MKTEKERILMGFRTIYLLKLHESITINNLIIIRVPGGWLYLVDYSDSSSITSCFVPFNNEFMPTDEESAR